MPCVLGSRAVNSGERQCGCRAGGRGEGGRVRTGEMRAGVSASRKGAEESGERGETAAGQGARGDGGGGLLRPGRGAAAWGLKHSLVSATARDGVLENALRVGGELPRPPAHADTYTLGKPRLKRGPRRRPPSASATGFLSPGAAWCIKHFLRSSQRSDCPSFIFSG